MGAGSRGDNKEQQLIEGWKAGSGHVHGDGQVWRDVSGAGQMGGVMGSGQVVPGARLASREVFVRKEERWVYDY